MLVVFGLVLVVNCVFAISWGVFWSDMIFVVCGWGFFCCCIVWGMVRICLVVVCLCGLFFGVVWLCV